jgi:hypothetical protein
MDTDAPKEDEPKKTRKVKKQVRKGDLAISSGTHSLDAAAKEAVREKEAQMMADDKLVADTDEKKNELEAYIYELRNKLDDQYAEFASDEEKSKLHEKLSTTEVSYRIRFNPSPMPHFSLTRFIGLAVRRGRRRNQGHLYRQDGRDPCHGRTYCPASLREGRE